MAIIQITTYRIEDKYSDKRHPLHTDYSTSPMDLGMTFFFCQQPAQFGGATLFVDPEVLIAALKEYDPELLEQLCNTEVELSRQGLKESKRVARIIDISGAEAILNWNYFRAAQIKDETVKEMVEKFHGFLEDKIVMGGLTTAVKLKVREGVFFHDSNVLHGRYSFIGDRCLKKGTIVLKDVDLVLAALEQNTLTDRS
ncbi:MAG: TauD/TfdA family dioxygenase [Flavobacteriales bacterium]|nr:TauD/TfdA family dioxygenase [Flavobacteriales bacterium]